MQPPTQPRPAPRPPVRRIVAFSLGVGVVIDLLVPQTHTGVNAPIVMAAFLAAAFLAAGRGGLRRMDPADAWLAPAALVLSAMAAVRTDPGLGFLDQVLAFLLAVGTVGTLAGARITRGLVPRIVELAFGLVAATVGGAIAVVARLGLLMPGSGTPTAAGGGAAGPVGAGAAESAPTRPGIRDRVRPALPVLRGLAIALPIAFVFVLLFASADAVFARWTADLVNWNLDLSEVVDHGLVIVPVAWLVAGLLAAAVGLLPGLVGPATPSPLTEILGTSEATRLIRLGTVEAATVLAVVVGLFGVFVGLQVAYLFGGLDTLAATGLTYAEYARRGFFELVAVAVLAGALVVALDLAVVGRSRAQLGAALALLALTALVLVSAFVRLRLYQDAYGWTELRFVVLTGIVDTAVSLALIAGLVLARRTAWTLHALGILVVLTVGVLNVVGPQAFVTEQNLARAINPSLVPEGGKSGLDTSYVSYMSEEVVVPIVEAWDRLPETEQAELGRILSAWGEVLRTDPTYLAWPSWNLARARALDALDTWEARQTAALSR